MRILLLTSSANALTARLEMELSEAGHTLAVHVVRGDERAEELAAAVDATRCDLVVAPTLMKILPEAVWGARPCLIVHPGVRGDRGVSSLDWAIAEGASTWGVTLLQAQAEVDAGDVWAWREFPMRAGGATKTSVYRHEVSTAAVACVLEAVAAFGRGERGRPLETLGREASGTHRRAMTHVDRAIDWHVDDTETVLRKVRASDTSPGSRCELVGAGDDVRVFGAHREGSLRLGLPGEVFAQRHGAVCVTTLDGAVWLTHARRGVGALKLPAAHVFGESAQWIPEIPTSTLRPPVAETWRDIWYEEVGDVGCVHFDVYNGALSTAQCVRLREVVRAARRRPTKVIVLMGGTDFFSNGIHLGAIEAAPSAAAESWANICAIDDVVLELIETTSHLVVASLGGDAAAGGMMMALAADRVFARSGVVMNPHYRALSLYGSEYWTYLLPRRVGDDQSLILTDRARPVGPRAAVAMGLIDAAFGDTLADHRARVLAEAQRLARDGGTLLRAKQARRARDEAAQPLAAYRDAELREMRAIFDDPAALYHAARRRFLYRGGATPARPTYPPLHRPASRARPRRSTDPSVVH
jgi:putative two-component system hydrogenase maturation factor HypX/HoxX